VEVVLDVSDLLDETEDDFVALLLLLLLFEGMLCFFLGRYL
jgi:hypothetical protein